MSKMENQPSSGPRVVISGAHSGIGQELIKVLAQHGISVLGLVTPWADVAGLASPEGLTEYLKCDLRDPLTHSVAGRLRDAEIFVHLAWARPGKSANATRENINIFSNVQAALPQGIKTVYMSSVCATIDNSSHYGQAKYHLSQIMDPDNTVEVITGLVRSKPAIGPFLALQNFVCTLHICFHFMPSPMTFMTSSEQVMDILSTAVLKFDTCPRLMPAFEPEPVRLIDLLADILTSRRVPYLSLPVPTGLALSVLYTMRKVLPSMAISDRLITLLTVSPEAIVERLQNEAERPS